MAMDDGGLLSFCETLMAVKVPLRKGLGMKRGLYDRKGPLFTGKELTTLKCWNSIKLLFRLQYLGYFMNASGGEGRLAKFSVSEFKANREGGFEHEKDGYLYVHGFMPDGFKHPKNFCTAR